MDTWQEINGRAGIQIGGMVLPPKLISRPYPAYDILVGGFKMNGFNEYLLNAKPGFGDLYMVSHLISRTAFVGHV